jgi:hypothetical protein
MSYFIFDLDETLAQMQEMFYFIASLTLKDIISQYTTFESMLFNHDLNQQLQNAYYLFVDRIVREERSNKPLGIIRPGILQIMKRLHNLKNQGKIVTVIIYSNNSHLESLEFIRDIIHNYIGSSRLISKCIHWNHSVREYDKLLYHNSGNKISKTWKTISAILHRNNNFDSINEQNVYFFDDLDHYDLQYTLKHNYYKVSPYKYIASFDRISKIYKSALLDAGVNIELFIKYCSVYLELNKQCIPKNDLVNIKSTADELIYMFKCKINNIGDEYFLPVPSMYDNGIHMIYRAIDIINMRNIKLKNMRNKTDKNIKYKGGKKKYYTVKKI